MLRWITISSMIYFYLVIMGHVNHYNILNSIKLLFNLTFTLSIISLVRTIIAPLVHPKVTDCHYHDDDIIPWPYSKKYKCDCPLIISQHPRSSHCKKCKTCIYHRDHHCIWLETCIGLHNHRYFIQFIFYLLCSIILGVYIISTFIIASQGETWKRMIMMANGRDGMMSRRGGIRFYQMPMRSSLSSPLLKIGTGEIMQIIHFIILVILMLLIGLLFIYQVYNMSHDTLTIEYYHDREKIYYNYNHQDGNNYANTDIMTKGIKKKREGEMESCNKAITIRPQIYNNLKLYLGDNLIKILFPV
jgi:hypothetical protein